MSNSYFTLTDKDDTGTAAVEEKRAYNGMERRFVIRRSGVDRRQEVRFEIGKDDRRQTEGRRDDDSTPKFW